MTRPANPKLIEEIQMVVAREIHMKGIEGITLRHIAECVGVTPTTIYYYYKNKEDLLDEIKLNAIAELDNYLIGRVDATATCKEQVAEFIRAFVQWALDHPQLLDLIFDRIPPKMDLGDEELLAIFYRSQMQALAVIEQGMANGEFTSADHHIDATVILGMVYGVVKLFLEKRTLPQYWEDITPLTERIVDLAMLILETKS